MYSYRNSRPRSFIQRNASRLLVSALGGALAFFAFMGPAASDFNSNSRVFSEGLNIKLDRGSPAFAALEDTLVAPVENNPRPGAEVKAIELAVGPSAEPLAEKLIKDIRREQSLLAQERTARVNNSIDMAQVAAQMLRRMASHVKPHVEPAIQVDEGTEPEPNVKTISLSDLNISREEMLASLFLPIARSGGPKASGASFGGARDESDMFIREHAAQTKTPPARQVVIAGPFEFAGGLALTNPMDRIVIYREIEGEIFESGQVWPREGRYEIFVEETVGQLIGELRAMPFGDVIGRGLLELSGLRRDQNAADRRRIVGAKLVLRPVPQGISGHVVSTESAGHKVKDAQVSFVGLPFDSVGMKTNKDGKFEQSGIVEGSSVIIKAQRPGFRPAITYAHSGDDNEIDLLSESEGRIVKSLLRISPISGDHGAIVWGRVTYRGSPVAGANVSLMTGTGQLKAVYFDSSMKPDPRLEETTANGFYAYFPVSSGAHAVQARFKNGRVSEPIVFPTEEKSVSRVDIESAREQSAKVRVFDAFRTDYPLPAELTLLGMNRGFMIDQSGSREIKFSGGRGLMNIDANVGPAYSRVRVALARDRRTIYLPMLQTAWIEKIRGEAKVNVEPGQGTVVGFVQGSAPYIARIDGASGARVVYFDSRGEPTGREYGEPGGGFAIFNAGEGFKSVIVQPSGSMKIYAAIALAERNVVNVINHSIR